MHVLHIFPLNISSPKPLHPMANSSLNLLSTILLLFSLPLSLSQTPPSPSPQLPPSPSRSADSPTSSPPLPPSDIESPSLPPTSSNGFRTPSPAPSHGVSADVEGMEEEGGGDGGLRGGQKAGIAVGVIAGVCVVGLGALVYKKRKENMDRAQFGHAARRDFL